MSLTYIVSTYYGSSETTYSFGPFRSEDSVDRFITRLEKAVPSAEEAHVTVLNSPSLVGTGSEMA